MYNQKLFHNLNSTMRKKIYLLTFLVLPFVLNSQSIENKKVLVVWGGWDGHQPKLFADLVVKWLESKNAEIHISNDMDIYDEYETLVKFDLIIQSVTMGEITGNQVKNLTKAVRSGVGIAGAHGGLGDSFRNSTPYQFMIGGQWVEHPGGKVKFEVNLIDDDLTQNLNNFEIFSEQYYMHYDPNIDIIATTKFDGKTYPWIEDVLMPVAWKKYYGKGKVFYISIGHDPNEFVQHQDAWELLTRGFIWSTRD